MDWLSLNLHFSKLVSELLLIFHWLLSNQVHSLVQKSIFYRERTTIGFVKRSGVRQIIRSQQSLPVMPFCTSKPLWHNEYHRPYIIYHIDTNALIHHHLVVTSTCTWEIIKLLCIDTINSTSWPEHDPNKCETATAQMWWDNQSKRMFSHENIFSKQARTFYYLIFIVFNTKTRFCNPRKQPNVKGRYFLFQV